MRMINTETLTSLSQLPGLVTKYGYNPDNYGFLVIWIPDAPGDLSCKLDIVKLIQSSVKSLFIDNSLSGDRFVVTTSLLDTLTLMNKCGGVNQPDQPVNTSVHLAWLTSDEEEYSVNWIDNISPELKQYFQEEKIRPATITKYICKNEALRRLV